MAKKPSRNQANTTAPILDIALERWKTQSRFNRWVRRGTISIDYLSGLMWAVLKLVGYGLVLGFGVMYLTVKKDPYLLIDGF